jgi:serine/threonine-protein kinase
LQEALGTEYTLERELGGGGMARVFVVVEKALGRRVVLKVLKPDLVEGVSVARFSQEIQFAAQLAHPHIVPVLSAGVAAGLPYYTMPYVEGESLRRKLEQSGALPIEEAVVVLRDVAKALVYAHAHDVVHRDIKPDNVLLAGGSAVVTDFGIAKAIVASRVDATRAPVTQVGTSLGTPAYMAPEQAAGDPRTSHPADCYSFGALAFELLAGRPPFHGMTPQDLLAAHMSEKPRSILELRAETPPELAALVMLCLEKEPSIRPSGVTILQSLDPVTSGATPARRHRWLVWPRRRRAAVLIGLSLATLIVTAVIGATSGLTWLSVDEFGSSRGRLESLVVLPLDNLTSDSTQDYFVEGMHEALTGQLMQISSLRVISRTSAMQYKASTKSVPVIARELGVDAVIEGSVFRAGDSVRIQVQLIGAKPERSLWTHAYVGDVRNVMALHSRVALEIGEQVRAAVTPQEASRLRVVRQVHPSAYEAWLQASYHASRRVGTDTEQCIRFAKDAIAVDSSYAEAYVVLADCYILKGFVTTAPPRHMFSLAKEAAQHAIAFNDSLASAYAILASALAFSDWDWLGAERAFRRALSLNPAFATAHGDYGWLLAWLGRFDEGIAHARQAEELSPVSPNAKQRLSIILCMARRFDDAIATAQRAVAIDSNYMFAYDRLRCAYDGKGDLQNALAAAKRASELGGPNDVRRSAFLGYSYGRAGRLAEARVILGELLARRKQTYVPPEAIASIYAGLGEHSQAIDWLSRAHEARDGNSVLLKVFPIWDPLRSDPRFRALVRRMRFPD